MVFSQSIGFQAVGLIPTGARVLRVPGELDIVSQTRFGPHSSLASRSCDRHRAVSRPSLPP